MECTNSPINNFRYKPLESNEDEDILVETNLGDSWMNKTQEGRSSPMRCSWYRFESENSITTISSPSKLDSTLRRCWRTFVFLTITITLLTIMVILVLTVFPSLEKASEVSVVSGNDRNESYSNAISTKDQSQIYWEKYVAAKIFALSSGAVTHRLNEPTSSIYCTGPGLVSFEIHSSFKQSWENVKLDKSCSEYLVTERLELSGIFSIQDLSHILSELPNLASLLFNSVKIVSPDFNSNHKNRTTILLPILTSLSFIELEASENLLPWFDETFDMPFLSEFCILKTTISELRAHTAISRILGKSHHLTTIVLVGIKATCRVLDYHTFIDLFNIDWPESLNDFTLIFSDPSDQQHRTIVEYFIASLTRITSNKFKQFLTNVPVNILSKKIIIKHFSGCNCYKVSFSMQPDKTGYDSPHALEVKTLVSTVNSTICDSDSDLFQKAIIGNWVSFCQDVQFQYLSGFDKPTFDSSLTVVAEGTVACSGKFAVGQQNFCTGLVTNTNSSYCKSAVLKN